MQRYFLLKYDTQHVRVFRYKNGFIEFLYFQDELLLLSDLLFSHSSSLIISREQLKKLFEYLNISSVHNLFLYHADSGELVVQHLNPEKESIYTLEKSRVKYWSDIFRRETEKFSTFQNFSLPYFGRNYLENFLKEVGLVIPENITILKIFYYGKFFFIPFELIYDCFLIEHIVPGDVCKGRKLIKKVGMFLDPDLEVSKREFLDMRALIEKRGFLFSNKNPDLLLISAHGMRGECSKLKNEALEAKVRELCPEIIVFNSCALGQEFEGLIAFCMSKGIKVIASPFDVLSNKTILGPILKFIKFSDKEHVWHTFLMLRIFYPTIYSYFRYYTSENFKKLKFSQSLNMKF